MAWNLIRKADEEDYAALNTSAERFIDRHNLARIDEDPTLTVYLAAWEDPYLAKLWKGCVRRALGCNADGIAWGYVGREA